MATGSRPQRPIVGSRTSTSRPRKVATRLPDPVVTQEPAPVPAPEPAPEPPPAPEVEAEVDERPRSRRTTLVLVVAIVLLVGLAAAEGWYLWLRDDPVVSVDRPVLTSQVATASAVDTAAKALQDIVETSWKDYDEQTDEATTKMTSTFAKEYRSTADAIADDIKKDKTEVNVEITGQGVVRASSEQVQALVFFTHLATHAGTDLTTTQYRALVTVVNTDKGWLVSDIDTK